MGIRSKHWVDIALEALEAKDRVRTLRPWNTCPVTVRLDGRSVHLFSSNDYLGLSTHPSIREALRIASVDVGMGPRGAALVCGYTQHHERLENTLAQLKNTEDALLCPSGYQANVALLSALGDADTVIFSDALNHASIIDGCRLSRAKIVVYNHKDVADLEAKLRDFPAKKQVVVTDEVFSMDGDHAPLKTLAELKERFGFIWVTDSAHSTLVCGPNGGGLSEALGVQGQIDFQVGTLSKAIGSHGGFVATSTKRRKWLLNTGRAFIFQRHFLFPSSWPPTMASRPPLRHHRFASGSGTM